MVLIGGPAVEIPQAITDKTTNVDTVMRPSPILLVTLAVVGLVGSGYSTCAPRDLAWKVAAI